RGTTDAAPIAFRQNGRGSTAPGGAVGDHPAPLGARMTNPTLPRLVAAALLFAGGLSLHWSACAQEAADPPSASAEPDAASGPAAIAPGQPALADRLSAFVADIEAARERLAPLMAAVDVAEAEAW